MNGKEDYEEDSDTYNAYLNSSNNSTTLSGLPMRERKPRKKKNKNNSKQNTEVECSTPTSQDGALKKPNVTCNNNQPIKTLPITQVTNITESSISANKNKVTTTTQPTNLMPPKSLLIQTPINISTKPQQIPSQQQTVTTSTSNQTKGISNVQIPQQQQHNSNLSNNYFLSNLQISNNNVPISQTQSYDAAKILLSNNAFLQASALQPSYNTNVLPTQQFRTQPSHLYGGTLPPQNYSHPLGGNADLINYSAYVRPNQQLQQFQQQQQQQRQQQQQLQQNNISYGFETSSNKNINQIYEIRCQVIDDLFRFIMELLRTEAGPTNEKIEAIKMTLDTLKN